MELALTQRDPKQVTSALRRCVLNAERCVQRMRLSDVVLSVSASHHSPNTTSDGPSDSQTALKPAAGNITNQQICCIFNTVVIVTLECLYLLS